MFWKELEEYGNKIREQIHQITKKFSVELYAVLGDNGSIGIFQPSTNCWYLIPVNPEQAYWFLIGLSNAKSL